ncbi:MAG: hypothetical protein GY788_29545 [bacterium]|nr:hypothetical protein [bacterium]
MLEWHGHLQLAAIAEAFGIESWLADGRSAVRYTLAMHGKSAAKNHDEYIAEVEDKPDLDEDVLTESIRESAGLPTTPPTEGRREAL